MDFFGVTMTWNITKIIKRLSVFVIMKRNNFLSSKTSSSCLHQDKHYVKSIQIRSFSGPYFPAFGLNIEIYGVNLRIQSEYRKIRTRKNSVFGHFSRSGIFARYAYRTS